MKENDVAYISEQFGIEKEIVEASVNDGTLSARIKDSLAKKKMYSEDEFSKLLSNHEHDVQTSYFNDLVEKAKKGDIPQDLYKPVKGAAYQQLERELSKKHEVNEFSNLEDLLSRIIKKSSANKNSDPDIEKQINELKQVNLKLQEEKENAIKTVEQEYKNKFLDKEKHSALDRVPFDFSSAKADEVNKVSQKTKTILKSVFDADYKLDYDEKNRLVVKDRENKIKKNSATLDPVSIDDVMIELAKEYNLKLKSPDKGGQGGKSSYSESGIFSSHEEFIEYCEKNKINPTSRQALDLLRKSNLYNSNQK